MFQKVGFPFGIITNLICLLVTTNIFFSNIVELKIEVLYEASKIAKDKHLGMVSINY